MHEFVPRQMLLMFYKSNGHDNFNLLEKELAIEVCCFSQYGLFGSEESAVTLRIRLLMIMEYKCCCFIL